jgi:hypothetical protein
MRARRIMTRRMMMVLMLYCPVLPKGEKIGFCIRSTKLWKTMVDLVKCDDMRDLFALTLSASASIQSIECSSLSHGRKHNSFLGWWF